jgi:hypothetical protein
MLNWKGNSAMASEHRQQIMALESKRRELSQEIGRIDAKIYELSLEEDRSEFTCGCVKLNRDIGVFDMNNQSELCRNRVGFCSCIVSESLTADKFCPACNGTGKQ